MAKKTKLELTWIGKENRPKLEPRILIEDKEKSYHSAVRHSEKDIFDNMLIHGDNLLALKALEQEYSGKVKCIYIDPPFNTGNAFEHYDDGVEHSLWLSLMRDRFELIRRLLNNDGILVLHLDNAEMAYAKVLLDEIFGRNNHLNTITVTTNDPSGFKATSSKIFSTANYLLVYAKDATTQPLKKVYIEKHYDTAYSKVLLNRDDDYLEWQWDSIGSVVAKNLGYTDSRSARRALGNEFEDEISNFAVANAPSVFQIAAIGGGAAIKRKETIEQSKITRDQVFVHPNEDVFGFYILNGRQILFYDKRLIEIDGRLVPGEAITDVWSDISWNGIASEGNVEFKNGKKPEALIERIMEIASNEGDLILDSFLGSGTTAAVAHKMGRRWIGIELGDHCDTHCVPRLKKVIDGEDQGGISKAVNWKGGGGFRYYRLAPSLILEDEWGNEVINKDYNPEMLAEAVCKLNGFIYSPSDECYWMHGHSTETDYIYITTQAMTVSMLEKISDEVGDDRSLLVCCSSFRCNAERFENLTLNKIPKSVLNKCQWGRDDYSLQIENLPQAPEEPEPEEKPKGKTKEDRRHGATLF